MKDEDLQIEFPWYLAFIITGLCCFGFVGFMKLLNSSLPPVFLWIGVGACTLGCIWGFFSVLFGEKKNTSACPQKGKQL